jgi:hypothetical protein
LKFVEGRRFLVVAATWVHRFRDPSTLVSLASRRLRSPAPTCTIPRYGGLLSFGIYAAGFAILIGGLVYAAHLVRMPMQWIVVGAVVMAGLGILSAVKATRQKDSAN